MAVFEQGTVLHLRQDEHRTGPRMPYSLSTRGARGRANRKTSHLRGISLPSVEVALADEPQTCVPGRPACGVRLTAFVSTSECFAFLVDNSFVNTRDLIAGRLVGVRGISRTRVVHRQKCRC